jgi:hypothetical protein
VLELISVHVPRTGGVALRDALIARYGARLFLDYAERPGMPEDPGTLPLPDLSPYTAVHGHFRATKYEATPCRVRMTVLRDPVAQLLSVYFYWRQTGPSHYGLHRWVLDEAPPLREFARALPRLLTEVYFAGANMERFDFIGRQEYLSEDLSALARSTGVRLAPVARVNEVHEGNVDYEAARADAALIRDLRSVLADEIAFYERWAGRGCT